MAGNWKSSTGVHILQDGEGVNYRNTSSQSVTQLVSKICVESSKGVLLGSGTESIIYWRKGVERIGQTWERVVPSYSLTDCQLFTEFEC